MCLSFLEYIHHEIHYLPLRCRCTCIEIKRNISWSILSCKWWLILLSAHWNEPIKRPGKVNGTYWMNVKADLNQLKADLKEIKWEHSQTCNPISDTMEWLTEIACTIFMHSTMNFLNIIAIIFFVWRIFLFKFGWLRYKKRSRPPWQKRKKKVHVYNTVLNLDNASSSSSMSFDSDSSTCVCDNSANVHICNDKSMFIGPITKTDKHYVATVGGVKNSATGMGTVRWTWKDDNGRPHTYDIKNVLYFPQSPVNILGITVFADQLNDDEGTGVDTTRTKSKFYWEGNKYHRTIIHPTSNLPELRINEGFKFSSLYSKNFSTKVCLDKQHCHCHLSSIIPDDGIDKKQIIELSDDIFHIGETLLYSNAGHTCYVKIEKILLDENGVLRFRVRSAANEVISATKESLKAPDSPDIGWIPTSVPKKQGPSSELAEEEIAKIMKLSKPVNLSPLQEEWVALHERLWHLPFSTMFRLVKMGFLPQKFLKLKGNCPPCVSCLFGQAHRKPWRFKRTNGGQPSTLRGDDISHPGDTVGVDQLISAQPGLVPQQRGIMTRARVWAATVFVDYVTGYTHVSLMNDQSGDATLAAKHEFEHLAATRGVKVKHYNADNGRFAEQTFLSDVKKCMQRITFCGVGAHHQNGISENAIKQLTLISRTLLVHAQRYWPEYITTMLWPFALKAAQDRLNQLNMNLDGKTPDMKFSGVAAHHIKLKDFHVFGCPCYVLDSRLQTNSKGVPKWEPRARLGIYLGRSPAHASSVALVLNPNTGLVSPQFHVVFDDDFSTVPHLRKGTVPPNWEKLVLNSREKSTDEFYDLTKTWFAPTADESAGELLDQNIPSEGGHTTPTINPSVIPSPHNLIPTVNQDSEGDTLPIPVVTQDSEGDVANDLFMPTMVNLETAGLRRSERISTQEPKKYNFFSVLSKICGVGLVLATSLASPVTVFSHGQATVNSVVHTCNVINANFDGSCNVIHHMVLAAGSSNNEAYTFREMLKEDDAGEFIKAMKKETETHERRNHWDVVKRSQVPVHVKTIQAIWSFKRKRFPDGLLNKYKARLCAHGGMQQWGVNYWETYAPVVNWVSVRFLLILSEIVGLNNRAIDFVLAFPQAKLDVPVYMELPIGMDVAGAGGNRRMYVLKLNRSLYGLKQASMNWYDMLKKGLEERGFKESVADPCVFMKEDMIVLVYVDDCILLSQNKTTIDDFITSLKNGPEGFEFTDEGSMERYLGVEITRHADKSGFTMTQPHLIERVLEAANIDLRMTNKRDTPAVLPLLSKDENGPERKHTWKYRTLTGMLGYLQHTTRPDISMATHQCARFNNDPKLCHERAIKRICKYLLGTMDKGIVFKPDITKGLECHVDADFAGGWSSGDHTNPEAVLSRTGFVISYAGCPIYWCSKLQTEIALSTTEAEYIALSQAMREVLPFLNLMGEIKDLLPVKNDKPKFYCTVWEDNRSCIKVAESPKFTPRTKHIALKYHHFRQFVNDIIFIFPIDTLEQNADILTKPLDHT